MIADLQIPEEHDYQVLFDAVHRFKGMLNAARVALPSDFETEFSHHYGIRRFPAVGAAFITVVNRAYCKKLILQLPGQRHPPHYHRQKEESFHVLWGELDLVIEGRERRLAPGDLVLVQQGVSHEFSTPTGVIFEELSTTHVAGDSFYEDKRINRMTNEERKTLVNHWGFGQLKNLGP